MARRYKDPNQRAQPVSISMSLDELAQFSVLVAELDTDRSKLGKAIIKFALKHKSEKVFKNEILKLLNEA